MPKLERSQWYDLCRDMNWSFKYVTEAEVFPEVLSKSHGIPAAAWWKWDAPYKIAYREYVTTRRRRMPARCNRTTVRILKAPKASEVAPLWRVEI